MSLTCRPRTVTPAGSAAGSCFATACRSVSTPWGIRRNNTATRPMERTSGPFELALRAMVADALVPASGAPPDHGLAATGAGELRRPLRRNGPAARGAMQIDACCHEL